MNPTDSAVAIAADLSQEDVLDRVGAARLRELLETSYASQHFTVERVGDQGPQLFSPRAGGLKLRRDDRILVVECRPGSPHPVGQRDVERLCAAARAQQATGAIFVTAGQFSPRARLIGEQQPDLQLIDNQLLRRMLGADVIAALEREYPPLPAPHDPVERTAASPPPPDHARSLSISIFPVLLLLVLLILAWLTSR